MDPLTHTATGLFLSRAGLNRWTPLATPILLLAANAPDIDTLIAAGNPFSEVQYHRHFMHSLIAMPALAVLSVLAVRIAIRKPIRWAGAVGAAFLGVASHLLLDLTNVFGERLLLPFSSRWFHLDLTSVVDLWIWCVLLLALAAPVLGRLVGSEIASTTVHPRRYGRGWACFALAFLLLYNSARGVLHARAVAELEARTYEAADPIRVMAGPDRVVPWHWRGIAETRDAYALENFSLAGEFDPTRATIFPKPEPAPAMEAARRTPVFQEFLSFSQFPLWRVLPVGDQPDVQKVEVMDLRFGSPQAPGFAATALVDGRGRVLRASFSYGLFRPL